MHRFRFFSLALLGLLFLPGQSLEAQRNWEISAIGEIGYMFSIRDMGKNAGELDDLQNFQIIASLNDAMVVSGGIEIGFPASDFGIRARFQTTVDGAAEGVAAICELLEGDICRPVPIDVDVRDFIVDARFVRGTPGSAVRPVLSLGLSLRDFAFGDFFDCPSAVQDPSGWGPTICENANLVWTDSSMSAGLVFGLGFIGEIGPLSLTVNGENQFGRYNGGVGRASGETMNDVVLSATAKIKVF